MPAITNPTMTLAQSGGVVTVTVTYDVSFLSSEVASPLVFMEQITVAGAVAPYNKFLGEPLNKTENTVSYQRTHAIERRNFVGGAIVPVTVQCLIKITPQGMINAVRSTNDAQLPGETVRSPFAARLMDFVRKSLDLVGQFFIRLSSKTRYDSLFDFKPDATHISALPEPLLRYIQELEASTAITNRNDGNV
ncbi:MAG: hypothetical protein JNM70_00015 [Anaerolineae bacterium]|nr:hypothetical protein [Anaerolineae bacterium]